MLFLSQGLLDPELLGTLKFYGTIAFDLAGSSLGGFLLGRFLDSAFGTRPWGMLICPLLGLAAGFSGVYRLVMNEAKKKKKPGR